jgi:hypothetical protein
VLDRVREKVREELLRLIEEDVVVPGVSPELKQAVEADALSLV